MLFLSLVLALNAESSRLELRIGIKPLLAANPVRCPAPHRRLRLMPATQEPIFVEAGGGRQRAVFLPQYMLTGAVPPRACGPTRKRRRFSAAASAHPPSTTCGPSSNMRNQATASPAVFETRRPWASGGCDHG